MLVICAALARSSVRASWSFAKPCETSTGPLSCMTSSRAGSAPVSSAISSIPTNASGRMSRRCLHPMRDAERSTARNSSSTRKRVRQRVFEMLPTQTQRLTLTASKNCLPDSAENGGADILQRHLLAALAPKDPATNGEPRCVEQASASPRSAGSLRCVHAQRVRPAWFIKCASRCAGSRAS